MKNHLPLSLKALPFAAAALVACLPGTSNAAIITYDAPILQNNDYPLLRVFNDRIGVGRTLRTVTGDRISRQAFVFPSPDSDYFPFTVGGQQYRTTNGSATTVEVNPGGAGGTRFY